MTTAFLPPAGPGVTGPICPVWCVGHNATYQSWEDVDDKWIRYHGSVDRLVHGVAIDCGRLRMPRADLTPTQTMAVAKRLLDAAEAAALHNETHRSTPRWRPSGSGGLTVARAIGAFNLGRDYQRGVDSGSAPTTPRPCPDWKREHHRTKALVVFYDDAGLRATVKLEWCPRVTCCRCRSTRTGRRELPLRV